jgi:hypothetical protein
VDELLPYLVSLEPSMNKAYNTARLIVLIHLVKYASDTAIRTNIQ